MPRSNAKKQSNKANDTRHSLSAESGVMTYVQAPKHKGTGPCLDITLITTFFQVVGLCSLS